MKPDGSEDVLLTAVQTGELADGRKIGAAAVAGGTSELTTMQDGATGTGNGTSLSVTGFGGAAIQLSGTFVATVTFEGTANGSDWVSLPAQNVATGAVATTASSAGVYVVSTLGLSDVRARISAYTSGNVTAKGRAIGLALQSASVNVTGSIPAGTNNIGDVDVLSVNGYSGAIAGATGAAVPAGGIQAAGSDGTNLQPLYMVSQGSNPPDAQKLLGSALIMAGSGAAWARLSTNGALTAGNTGANMLPAGVWLYSGSGFDQERNNTEASPVTSAARTTSGNSADITVYNGAMLAVFLDSAAGTGTTPTLDVTVKVKDPASGKYFTVGTFTQVTDAGASTQSLFIGAGADTEFITRTYRIEWVITGTTPSFTFSVGVAATVA